MEEKENKKIPSNLFEVVFEMISTIDEIDKEKGNQEKALKDYHNKSINKVEKIIKG
ncbi:MAG: hypothetical protein GX327_00455 [Epulopiscium sp.]|jgi:hypothetical protein|nr:hypothetical protein [Candidatus Epulonipiscium sp.]